MSKRNVYDEYSPKAGPRGTSTTENLKYWSGRAHANSKLAPRATDKPVRLPSTGGVASVHSTSAEPRSKPAVDKRMTDGPRRGYMSGVRRTIGGV